jgi:hypothetical protein
LQILNRIFYGLFFRCNIMKNHTQLAFISGVFMTLALGWSICKPAFAQIGPGEDPIILNKITPTDLRPAGPVARSGSLDPLFGMQGWLRARVTRYEARAYSDNGSDTIITENDAITTASTQGLNKVCVQEVGSTAASTGLGGKYGPKGAAQIVVLKGDLVNICK